MTRTFALFLAALAAAVLFVAIVYAVLVTAHLSEPAVTTVHGLTSRRLWATATAALALGAVVIAGLVLVRPASCFGISARPGPSVAIAIGTIAAINGGLVLTVANGGPGTGNGAVGGAGALVLGLIASALGGMALIRSRRTE